MVLVVIFSACAIYLGDYYKADRNAISAFSQKSSVLKEETDNMVICKPENPSAGFIFYPGGKVEYTSYEPLMEACAEKGILCVLVEMPFNLAVFDVNAAECIQEKFPEIKSWYIGGHSLGGSMAASYLGENINSFDGLILLGSYSTVNFSATDIDVLSVYGSEDKVLNQEKYNENKQNLPADYEEFEIAGGCHAFFGMYGAQDGDGNPAISNEKQIEITAEKIGEFVKR